MTTSRTEKEQVRVHIRWMIRRDMPEVLLAEQASFEYAWTEEDFLRCLRQRNCIGMVAECGERVVGFMIYELHKSKLHVLNFAVHPTFRRQGVGQQMVAKLIGKLSSHRRTRITLAVRETNLPAQLFFKSLGFLAVRVLRGYYEDSGEDAFLMQYRIADDTGDEADGAKAMKQQLTDLTNQQAANNTAIQGQLKVIGEKLESLRTTLDLSVQANTAEITALKKQMDKLQSDFLTLQRQVEAMPHESR